MPGRRRSEQNVNEIRTKRSDMTKKKKRKKRGKNKNAPEPGGDASTIVEEEDYDDDAGAASGSGGEEEAAGVDAGGKTGGVGDDAGAEAGSAATTAAASSAEANASSSSAAPLGEGEGGESAAADFLDAEAAMLAEEAAAEAEEAAASQRKADLKAAKRAAKKAAKKGGNKNKSLLASFHNTKDARKAARIEAAAAVTPVGGFLDSVNAQEEKERTGELSDSEDGDVKSGDAGDAAGAEAAAEAEISARQKRKEKKAAKLEAKRLAALNRGGGSDEAEDGEEDAQGLPAVLSGSAAAADADPELGELATEVEVLAASQRKAAKKAAKEKQKKVKKWNRMGDLGDELEVLQTVESAASAAAAAEEIADEDGAASAASRGKGQHSAGKTRPAKAKKTKKKKSKEEAALEAEQELEMLLAEAEADGDAAVAAAEAGTDTLAAANAAAAAAASNADDAVDDDGDEDYETDSDEEFEPWVPDYKESLFDGHISESFQDNVVYMWRENSFFVPNTGLLKDPMGLFSYLQEKVKRHHTCLACNKKFYSAEAVRGHMKDKSHCKVSFKGDDGAAELAAFYKVTATTDDVGTTLALGTTGAKLRVASTGELVLRDGTRIGHRSMRRYYKQNFSEHQAEMDARQRVAKSMRGLKGKVALREANKMRNGMLVKSMLKAKGNSKALASNYTFKQETAWNKHRAAIIHHWGAGGGGSHYNMAGSKQFQKGVRVKGVVLRHSKQGAKLQAARNKSNRGTASMGMQKGKAKN